MNGIGIAVYLLTSKGKINVFGFFPLPCRSSLPPFTKPLSFSNFSKALIIIVTRRFFYMKTVKIKVIQNFMEITFYIKTYSKRTCWKKFFKFKFWLFLLTFEDEFGFRQLRPGNNHQQIKTKTLCQKLKLKIKCWITFFSKFFQRNS